MKAFMEEYGRILVSALVVLVLVASAKGLGSNIQGGIQAAVTGFTDKMEAVIDKFEKNEGEEIITASGSYIYVNDVSPTNHNLKVNLTSDSVTDFSSVEVTCAGKNILDITDLTPNANASDFEIDTDSNSFRFTKTSAAKTESYVSETKYLPAGTYVFSGTYANPNVVVIRKYQANSIVAQAQYWESVKSFSITEAGVYEILYMAGYDAEADSIVEFSEVQLEFGTDATEYESHTEQTVIANADGSVSGLTSVSPNMTVIAAHDDVEITCEYQKKK